LIAAAGASYAALTARTAASLLVRHTADARLAVKELQSALLVSGFALDAYAASGDRRERESLQQAAAKVQPTIATLRVLAEQHPEEKPRIDRLAADAEIVRAEQAHIVSLVDAGDVQGARGIAQRGVGREAFDRALATLARLDEDEVRAHETRQEAWSRSVVVSNAVLGVALSVLLVLLVLEARLVREDIRLREADRAERERSLIVQQRLMAVVSHDLRNPLAAMLAAASALARSDGSRDPAPVLRRIIAAGTRMERLIRDLLDWSRVERGVPIPVSVREADLYAVCEQIASEARDREGDRVQVEREGETRAVFDPDRMEQVVGNLLSNALRHAPAGTQVHVRAVGTADEVRLEVQDQGPGVPANAVATIFDPFRQGPSDRGSGLGLGLFIVRALVQAHGGTVELQSSPGKTTFAVRLPRGASSKEHPRAVPRGS
jgi:signal transduction histidine kinase